MMSADVPEIPPVTVTDIGAPLPPRGSISADGSLRDISPTVLGMLGIPQPKEMTGHDLREQKK